MNITEDNAAGYIGMAVELVIEKATPNVRSGEIMLIRREKVWSEGGKGAEPGDTCASLVDIWQVLVFWRFFDDKPGFGGIPESLISWRQMARLKSKGLSLSYSISPPGKRARSVVWRPRNCGRSRRPLPIL